MYQKGLIIGSTSSTNLHELELFACCIGITEQNLRLFVLLLWLGGSAGVTNRVAPHFDTLPHSHTMRSRMGFFHHPFGGELKNSWFHDGITVHSLQLPPSANLSTVFVWISMIGTSERASQAAHRTSRNSPFWDQPSTVLEDDMSKYS